MYQTMADPLITLTTDFGAADAYVAAMKGVILAINPAARLLDLSHEIPPQDTLHAAMILLGAVPYFPPGALHIVVVDPGVGTERALLYAECGAQRLLLPDNGVLSLLEKKLPVGRAIQLQDSRFWRPDVSRTFHGRDILAPVAGHLSLGLKPALLGPVASTWHRLTLPEPRIFHDRVEGEVMHVDRFGNLITTIRAGHVHQRRLGELEICGQRLPFVETYAAAGPGQAVALLSSEGFVEVAIRQGNAAARLGAGRGTAVTVHVA
jgi:S-adenosylmethionine hydrolase